MPKIEQSEIENLDIGKFDYLLVFLLLVLSGNPITYYIGEWLYVIIALLMLMYIFIKSKPWISSDFLRVTTIVFIVFIFQFICIEQVSLPANINFFARIYCGFLIVNLVGEKFRYAYFQLMTGISSISLVLFGFNYIGLNFPGFHFDRYISVVIYNYLTKTADGVRNCGMFWEPGAFQGYILLVAMLYISDIKKLWMKHHRECIILIMALVTTFSTTGYVTFAILMFLLVIKNVHNPIYKVLMIIAVVIASIYAFNTLEFLGNKMMGEFTKAQKISHGDISWTRMGSAQIDLKNIERHPFVGNGFLMEQKYKGIGNKMAGAGNGFTGVINSFGIPFMIFFLSNLFRKIPSNDNYEKACFLILFILLLNGEYFLNYPLFWSLLFVIYPQNEYLYETDRSTNNSF